MCNYTDERGQDGYFGRTAVLHPDQHPLWRRTSHRAPAPTGSRLVFGSYFICIWQWFLSWGFSHFMLVLVPRPHFLAFPAFFPLSLFQVSNKILVKKKDKNKFNFQGHYWQDQRWGLRKVNQAQCHTEHNDSKYIYVLSGHSQ